jgi:hypothetical protein
MLGVVYKTFMLNVIMLSVVMLNVIMLSVVAPKGDCQIEFLYFNISLQMLDKGRLHTQHNETLRLGSTIMLSIMLF